MIITEDEVVRLHEGALWILRTMGMIIHSDEARERLAEYGAQVDSHTRVVKFPEETVHRLVGMAPSVYTLGGRVRQRDLALTLTSALTRPIAGCNHFFDSATQRRRDPTTQDMVRAAALVNALPSFDCNAAFVYGTDEPPLTRAIHYFRLLLGHTEKHICMSPYGPRDVHYMIRMASAVQGGKEQLARRPVFNFMVSPASPLVFSEHFATAVMVGALASVPVMMGSTPIAGGTGPVTLAGLVALTHAENLVGVMIAQATNPGAPVYVAPRPTGMDMRTGLSLWGSIEWGIASSAAVQVARWCGLPTDFMGVGTDSKLPDQQAGMERGMMAVLAALTAPSLISGGGYIDTINTGSLEQLAIDDEIIAMAQRVTRGIEVDTEHMALDVIARVGYGSTYLGEVHTRDHFRTEAFQAQLADRNSYGSWEESGGKDIVTRARERVDQILATHETPRLPEDLSRELDSILEAARREMGDL